MADWMAYVVAGLGVLSIGVSKAGFGGGLGMLTTPLCVLAFTSIGRSPTFVIGMLLPLLVVGDMVSLWHYWKQWRGPNLIYILPGIILGVVGGVQLIGQISPRVLNVIIGLLSVVFVAFQWFKEAILKAEGPFKPNHRIGLPFGLAAGLTSSFSHGAGPIMSMYLIPQRLPKDVYIGTRVLIFTWINWIKVPFFAFDGIITQETLLTGLLFLPIVPLGAWLGVAITRRISEAAFLNWVYIFTLLAGLQLVFEFDFAALFHR